MSVIAPCPAPFRVAAPAVYLLAGQQRVQPRQQGLQALVHSVQARQVLGQGGLLGLQGADCVLEGRQFPAVVLQGLRVGDLVVAQKLFCLCQRFFEHPFQFRHGLFPHDAPCVLFASHAAVDDCPAFRGQQVVLAVRVQRLQPLERVPDCGALRFQGFFLLLERRYLCP